MCVCVFFFSCTSEKKGHLLLGEWPAFWFVSAGDLSGYVDPFKKRSPELGTAQLLFQMISPQEGTAPVKGSPVASCRGRAVRCCGLGSGYFPNLYNPSPGQQCFVRGASEKTEKNGRNFHGLQRHL